MNVKRGAQNRVAQEVRDSEKAGDPFPGWIPLGTRQSDTSSRRPRWS